MSFGNYWGFYPSSVKPAASVPEPPPKPHGEAVTPALLSWLKVNADDGWCSAEAYEEMKTLVQKRDAFGRAKYGQPLMTKDGRNTAEDALQELGDLAQYMFKARMNGESLAEVIRLLPMLEMIARQRMRFE